MDAQITRAAPAGLARAFRQSSRSPIGFPRRFSGHFRGNNAAKLFNKTGHYFDASRSVFVKPPKADIAKGCRHVRFVPEADFLAPVRYD